MYELTFSKKNYKSWDVSVDLYKEYQEFNVALEK